jgi:rod shape determining protein RodA
VIKRDNVLANWTRRIDWPLMVAVAVLLIVGLVSVYSAVSPSGNPGRFMIKQLSAVGLGLFIMVVMTTVNYQVFRAYPWGIYGLGVLVLLTVLAIGKRIHGAKSWIILGPLSIEPVELARIAFVVAIAGFLDRPERDLRSFKWVLFIFALGGVHMVLILLEPYLGGSLAYGPIMLSLLFFAGVPVIYLFGILFFGSVAGGIPILSTYFSLQPQLLDAHSVVKFLVHSAAGTRSAIELLFLTTGLIFAGWWFLRKLHVRLPWHYPMILSLIMGLSVYTAHSIEHLIKDYQRKRIVVFLSPGFDPLGAGYNILQSEIAIGSGGFFGKGLFSGTQTQLGFLPEKHTDFIFSVIGEELGFIWAAVVILAFAVLVWRAFVIATETQDRFGTLIAVGIGCLFGFQAFMNIGMVLGLMPVTGVALPFVSYGGSHVVSALLSVGLLQSVNFRRYIY